MLVEKSILTVSSSPFKSGEYDLFTVEEILLMLVELPHKSEKGAETSRLSRQLYHLHLLSETHS
jgi:hypothetical protein